MNFRQLRELGEKGRRREPQKERRPTLTSQEERFLYNAHLKNIELRTLMCTLRESLPKEVLDEVIVDYSMRLKKAKRNFEDNNWKAEWYDGPEV